MPRKDGRLEPGQSIHGAISARAWNRAQDAADIVLNDRYSVSGESGGASSKPYTWAYCKSSVDIDRWGILAITGLDITPTSTESDTATRTFQDSPVLRADIPTLSSTAWCVAVEPIGADKVGKVAVAGVVQCKVEIKNASDQYVMAKQSADELRSGSSGEGLILWKDAGTGSGKWALIRIGNTRSHVRGTFSGNWSKGGTVTVTDAVDGVTYSAKNYFATLTNSGTKACCIAWVAGEWIVVAAEC